MTTHYPFGGGGAGGGSGVDVSRFIVAEEITGEDGIETVFATANPYVGGTLAIYRDGIRLRRTADYTETDPNTGDFTLNVAPDADEEVIVDYIKQ